MDKYVIQLRSTNFPYYLCFDPDDRRPVSWTHYLERAEKFNTEAEADENADCWGIIDFDIVKIKQP